MNKLPLISIILPAYNEALSLPIIIEQIRSIASICKVDIEILIVDDGSTDNTDLVIRKLIEEEKQENNIKYIQFSRNFGKEIAISAGLQNALGDAVIIIDADGQHPPELIKDFIELWQQGNDIVYGIQKNHTESKFNKLCKTWYYRCLEKITSIDIPPNAGDFRLLDAKVVKSLNLFNERTRYMKGLYAWVGYKSIGIEFTVKPRLQGKSKFGLIKLFKLGLMGLTGFSVIPLRLVSLAGFIVSISSIFYGIWLVFEHIVYKNHLAGWATLSVGMMFLGGVQLLALGIIGEYIGNIFEEVKQRPLYIINKNNNK